MKKNVLFLVILIFSSSFYTAQAQRGGVRIAYIDTEYILENIPEYQEAITQLNDKGLQWKKQVELKLSEIEQKRKNLSNERVLLTKELIQEREEEISFEESEILDYQQKRFGPNGDLYIQQKQLMQPVQDQIFAAVQDIAENKKYDFIFDKSSDAVMLYTAKQYDLSDLIIRNITRTAKRKQASSRAERKEAKEEDLTTDESNPELLERQKALEEKKSAREQAIEKAKQDKIVAREAKVKEAEERRKKTLEVKEPIKQESLNVEGSKTEQSSDVNKDPKTTETIGDETKTRAQFIEEANQKKLAEKEARLKAIEEKRKKILEERETTKQNSLNIDTPKTNESSEINKAEESPVIKTEETKTRAQLTEEANQKRVAEKEARLKAIEEKRKKILEDRQKTKDSTNTN